MIKLGVSQPPARKVKKITASLLISELVILAIFVGLAYYIGELCCG